MDDDTLRRAHEICALISNQKCSDLAPDNCDPDSCYIFELLRLGRDVAVAQPNS